MKRFSQRYTYVCNEAISWASRQEDQTAKECYKRISAVGKVLKKTALPDSKVDEVHLLGENDEVVVFVHLPFGIELGDQATRLLVALEEWLKKKGCDLAPTDSEHPQP